MDGAKFPPHMPLETMRRADWTNATASSREANETVGRWSVIDHFERGASAHV